MRKVIIIGCCGLGLSVANKLSAQSINTYLLSYEDVGQLNSSLKDDYHFNLLKESKSTLASLTRYINNYLLNEKQQDTSYHYLKTDLDEGYVFGLQNRMSPRRGALY